MPCMRSLCSPDDMEVDTESPEDLKARARLAAKLAALGEAPPLPQGDPAAVIERRLSHAAASTSAGVHSGSDGTVTSLTVEAVRQTIADLYQRVPTGMCANCHAHAPVIKRCALPPGIAAQLVFRAALVFPTCCITQSPALASSKGLQGS